MPSPRRTSGVLAAATLPLLLVLFSTGCSKNPPAPSTIGGPGGTTQVASGEALYASSGCNRCHGTIGAEEGRRAPDLSHEGAKADRTEQWITEQIKNPRSHNPQSRMPGFAGRMSDTDVEALARYIASLK